MDTNNPSNTYAKITYFDVIAGQKVPVKKIKLSIEKD